MAEAVLQLSGRVIKVTHDRVQIVFPAGTIHAAAVKRSVESAAEPAGASFESLKYDADLPVRNAIGPTLRLDANADE